VVPTDFTPIAALLGGGMIGLAALLLMATTGRMAGVSGIVARLLPPHADPSFAGRLAFVVGLVAAPLLVFAASGEAPKITIEAGPGLLILAGLLVGFGAVWGNGCTSGHGGAARGRPSRRSASVAFPR